MIIAQATCKASLAFTPGLDKSVAFDNMAAFSAISSVANCFHFPIAYLFSGKGLAEFS